VNYPTAQAGSILLQRALPETRSCRLSTDVYVWVVFLASHQSSCLTGQVINITREQEMP
jgi:hypothetical protein